MVSKISNISNNSMIKDQKVQLSSCQRMINLVLRIVTLNLFHWIQNNRLWEGLKNGDLSLAANAIQWGAAIHLNAMQISQLSRECKQEESIRFYSNQSAKNWDLIKARDLFKSGIDPIIERILPLSSVPQMYLYWVEIDNPSEDRQGYYIDSTKNYDYSHAPTPEAHKKLYPKSGDSMTVKVTRAFLDDEIIREPSTSFGYVK